MSTHKHIDRICAVFLLLSILLTLAFLNGEAFGLQSASRTLGYEDRIFDAGRVHTIDIVMDGWESFIDTCENEEYAACAVVIDGEAYHNVGIRAKGNTSLTTVSSMGSDRYSFKIEFDQYDSAQSYYGLDKLSLNNLIQDATFMKDYLTYRMMAAFGVDAPLCSYAYLTVNGEDWGIYLAVEGVEDAFLQRSYGRDHGELYKPDSTSLGGGRGNGRQFDPADLAGNEERGRLEGFDPSAMLDGEPPEASDAFAAPEMGGDPASGAPQTPREGGGVGGSPSGMGSSDVKLQYIDDDPDSYANIFGNAKTDPNAAAQARLIQALKILSVGGDAASAVNVEEVIRYFVVHNFVCNGDSYTGTIVHNYYLYEEDGILSMIPWDYNLAFGTFQASDATAQVNSPIDTPVSGGATGDRPMVDWIFSSVEYTALYHQYFASFLESTDFSALIDEAAALIAPYVEKDPTKFYSYEEFETGVEALREFCLLRAKSVAGQLDGTIPSTTSGQSADRSSLIDASHLNLSDMGSMETDSPGGAGMGWNQRPTEELPDQSSGQLQPRQSGGGSFEPPTDGRGAGDRFEQASPTQPNGLVLLAVSLLILCGGIWIALRFRR